MTDVQFCLVMMAIYSSHGMSPSWRSPIGTGWFLLALVLWIAESVK